MKFLYLLVDFFAMLIPFLFSFHPKIKFYKSWLEFLIASFSVAIIFIAWDSVYTNLGIWNFNPRYLTGIYLFSLPIEEILFFICIPYSCIFTFFCLDKFYHFKWNARNENIFCILLSGILLITGIAFIGRLYTSVTFISTSVICIFLKFILKISWFGEAISVYAILLIPFLIVNGILTGTGINEPVVIYNRSEIMNIRLFTIPAEDIFYGLELFLLNLTIFLYLRKRQIKKTNSPKPKSYP